MKGKVGTPSPRKQPRKVARKAQSRAASLEPDLRVSEELLLDDEVLSDPPQGLASRLDTMMDMIVALSQRVNSQAEVVHQHDDAPSTSQLRPQAKRRRAACPDSPVQDCSIDQAV